MVKFLLCNKNTATINTIVNWNQNILQEHIMNTLSRLDFYL